MPTTRERLYELVCQYPDHEEIRVVASDDEALEAGYFVGAIITHASQTWQIYRLDSEDPPKLRYLCAPSLQQSGASAPAFGSPEGPAFSMSTPMIKTQLEKLVRELRPHERWHKRVTTKELADYALDNHDAASRDPRVWRALDLARVVRPRLN
jgi:hypothetical protein